MESDGEAKVRLDIASKIWHRENKVPEPLRDDCPDTRLTEWAERETWTPDQAAMLVYGYDPGTYSANYQVPGLKGVTGLCGNGFCGDDAFYYTERLAKDWRRRVNASEKVVPAEFIDWCNKHRIDTRWLRSMHTAPAASEIPVRTQEPAAAPPAVAPTKSASAGVTVHSTKTKGRNILDPVIETAQGQCTDPKDTAQVWAQMQVLAQVEHPPLLAATDNGLKYTKNGNDAYLTRDALDKRLHPDKRKPRRPTPPAAV